MLRNEIPEFNSFHFCLEPSKNSTRNFVAFVKDKTLKERVESAKNHNNCAMKLKMLLLLIILRESLTKTDKRMKNILTEGSFANCLFG